MKVSFVTTVLNEEKSVKFLLSSLTHQSKKPDEIIIVDGGSKDETVKIIREFALSIKSKEFISKFRLIIKKGNRAVGRNTGIEKAKGQIIALSDSGCVLDRDWLRNIIKPFKDQSTEVVAGYYKGLAVSVFQECLVPYVLVMPDRVNPKSFLPSARSMAIRKYVWKKEGGFPQEFSSNEDYVFSRKLKKGGRKIVLRKNAIAYWFPRENIVQAFLMFFKFAVGDASAGVLRPKAILTMVRYILVLWILTYSFYLNPFFMLELFSYILVLYIVWSVWKNYRYVKKPGAFLFLPLIQFTSDLAVISGTVIGLFKGL